MLATYIIHSFQSRNKIKNFHKMKLHEVFKTNFGSSLFRFAVEKTLAVPQMLVMYHFHDMHVMSLAIISSAVVNFDLCFCDISATIVVYYISCQCSSAFTG